MNNLIIFTRSVLELNFFLKVYKEGMAVEEEFVFITSSSKTQLLPFYIKIWLLFPAPH